MKIHYRSEAKLSPLFGLQRGDDIYIRQDLPKWAVMATIVHEIYHAWDESTNPLWREIKAILAQFFMPILGSVIVVFMSLSRKRLTFYWRRITQGNKGED